MQQTAIFAAGCFWGVEDIFRKTPGVIDVEVGYTGGHVANPSYQMVCSDNTGHAEAVKVVFDDQKISYEQLLYVFWENHDPTTKNRQGPDSGSQYRSAIFYLNEEQQNMAEKVKKQLEQTKTFKAPIVTEIVPATEFYRAEEYHQRYFEKNDLSRQCHIRKKD